MDRSCQVLLVVFVTVICTVFGQDPTVNITETQPGKVHNRIEVNRDNSVTMDCFVENKQQHTRIRWNKYYTDATGREQLQKISDDLSVEDNTKNSIEKPTSFTWRLRIKNIQLTDAGKYTCFVYTTLDNRKDANVTVIVKIAPYLDLSRTSSDITARQGDTIDLFCNASGLPPPTIEWSRLGGGRLPIGKEKHYEPKMTIIGVQPQDRGKYRCRAYNLIGGKQQIVIRDVNLKVIFKPVVEAVHPEVLQAVGYIIELQCAVEMNPYPRGSGDGSLVWVKGARIMSQSIGRYKIKYFLGAFNKLFFEMTINGVQEEDYGAYKCQVKNSEGISTANVVLMESSEPRPSYKIGVIQKGSNANHLLLSISTLCMCVLVGLLHLL